MPAHTERTLMSYAIELSLYAIALAAILWLQGCREPLPEFVWPDADTKITIDDAGIQSGAPLPADATAATQEIDRLPVLSLPGESADTSVEKTQSSCTGGACPTAPTAPSRRFFGRRR